MTDKVPTAKPSEVAAAEASARANREAVKPHDDVERLAASRRADHDLHEAEARKTAVADDAARGRGIGRSEGWDGDYAMPREGQIVLAQLKNGPLVVAQYRTDPETLRLRRARAVDARNPDRRDTARFEEDRRLGRDPAGPVVRGDFYASHAGGAEYAVVQAPVVAWAEIPQIGNMKPVPTDEELADLRRDWDRGRDRAVA